MINEIQIVKQQMLENLEKIELLQNSVDRFAFSAKEAFNKLRVIVTFISSYAFANTDEEVLFFKEDFPSLYSLYLYFSRALETEVKKKSKLPGSLKPELEDENKIVEIFFENNKEFLKYYFSGESTMDNRIYTRNGLSLWPFDNAQPVIDSIIPTASVKISWLKAYDFYTAYLRRELIRINAQTEKSDPNQNEESDKLEFKGPKSFIVEGIVSLTKSGLIWINGKKATSVDLVRRPPRRSI